MIKDLFKAVCLALAVICLPVIFSRCAKNTQKPNDTITTIIRDTTIDTSIVKVDTSINLGRGLVLYYPFSNNAGDSSGNHFNGSVFGGVTFTTDKNGNTNGAAQFDGSSGYILVTDNGTLSPASFTVATQFLVNTAVHQNIFSKINYTTATSASLGLSLFGGAPVYPNSASFAARGPSAACGQPDYVYDSDLVYSMQDIQVSQWYHIACVFDKGVEKIYLNGVLKNAITRGFVNPKQCSDAQLILGDWWQGDHFRFSGKLDEFRMYNRALNDLEIKQLAKGF
jgi:hypothetical protein